MPTRTDTTAALPMWCLAGQPWAAAAPSSWARWMAADGFRLNGAAVNDETGFSVSDAGDVNGDGFDDLLVGAYGVASSGDDTGAAYVVFGGATVGDSGTIELGSLSAPDGFVLNGAAANDHAGCVGERGGRCERRHLRRPDRRRLWGRRERVLRLRRGLCGVWGSNRGQRRPRCAERAGWHGWLRREGRGGERLRWHSGERRGRCERRHLRRPDHRRLWGRRERILQLRGGLCGVWRGNGGRQRRRRAERAGWHGWLRPERRSVLRLCGPRR